MVEKYGENVKSKNISNFKSVIMEAEQGQQMKRLYLISQC